MTSGGSESQRCRCSSVQAACSAHTWHVCALALAPRLPLQTPDTSGCDAVSCCCCLCCLVVLLPVLLGCLQPTLLVLLSLRCW